MAPGGTIFHIKDRYSSMRNFQSLIKKQFNLKTYNGFPNFPPKKAFNNTSAEFLANRMNMLQTFFNTFFALPDIANQASNMVMYFKEKKADPQSAAKIEELIDYFDKKINQR
jgi:hypothetical protein